MANRRYSSIPKSLVNADSASVDCNYGPWASISEYEEWLTENVGVEHPLDGTRIAVKDDVTGKITCYVYEGIEGAEWREDGGMTEVQKAQLEELASRFVLDEENKRLLVYGDPQEESEEEEETEPVGESVGESEEESEESEGESEEEPAVDTRRRYFVNLTELVAPNTPTVATTTYYVVIGNAAVAVTNQTSGATMYWRSSIDNGTTWTSWAVTTGTVSLASGFSNATGNTNKVYKLQVKAIKNGEESEVGEHTITIMPKVAQPVISVGGDDYDTSRTVTITCATSGAAIRYTTDNSEPTEESTLYQAAFDITDVSDTTTTVKAKAFVTNYQASANSTSVRVNRPKTYYGWSSKSDYTQLTPSSDLSESVKADTLARNTNYNLPDDGEKYIWVCCTADFSTGNAYPDTTHYLPLGFALQGTTDDGYKCYRTNNTQSSSVKMISMA